MLAGIKEILVITTLQDKTSFERLLGSGAQFGLRISYAVQPDPNGIGQAFVIGRDFIGDDRVALILGDNIFYGHGLSDLLSKTATHCDGAAIFAYTVSDPERYGIVEIDSTGKAISIEEKPQVPRSNLAVTGLYFYDNNVIEIAAKLRPSFRGELEITDINRLYLEQNALRVIVMGRGFAWLDTGTHESLLYAAQFVEVLERRQGLKLCCPEEIAFRQHFIDRKELIIASKRYGSSPYASYLMSVAQEKL
jgi:glucose-1-phosphate thymidylyltransferase